MSDPLQVYLEIPSDFTGVDSPFLLITDIGTQVYEHDGATAIMVGWTGQIKFPTVAALKAWTGTLGPVGTRLNAGGYRYVVGAVVDAGTYWSTDGGVPLLFERNQPYSIQSAGGSPSADALTNTEACRAIARYVNARGGGLVEISGGEFEVLYQTVNPTPGNGQPYYQGADLFAFSGLDGLIVNFIEGGSLKAANGLRYGAFDPVTGEPHPGVGSGSQFAANVGNIINVTQSRNVRITGARINGNNDTYILGGRWGDTGIQLQAIGVRLNQVQEAVVENFYIERCGLDGVYIGGTARQRINVTIQNGRSLYNGRQGMSWVGGWGLIVANADFAFTGMAGVSSAPRAGIDIEHNLQGLGDGYFYNVRSYENLGASVVNPRNTGNGSVVFEQCLLQNQGGRRALWYQDKSPNAKFIDCKIYGSVVNVDYCQFIRCYFTNAVWDEALPEGGIVGRFIDVNSPAIWEDCLFEDVQAGTRNVFVRGSATLKRLTHVVGKPIAVAREVVTTIGPCRLIEDCTWVQAFGDPSPAEPAGEASVIERGGDIGLTVWRGKNTVSGSALAFGSRLGQRNMTVRRVSRTYNPPSIAAGASISTTLDARETQPNDLANVSFSLPLNGLIMSWVTSNHTITVTFFNPTAAPINLDEGVLTGISYAA